MFRQGKKMNKKSEILRKTLTEGASPHKIANRVIEHARKHFGDQWVGSAIIQISLLLKLNIPDASALISEHCTQQIRG